jgi:hypothetical protein
MERTVRRGEGHVDIGVLLALDLRQVFALAHPNTHAARDCIRVHHSTSWPYRNRPVTWCKGKFSRGVVAMRTHAEPGNISHHKRVYLRGRLRVLLCTVRLAGVCSQLVDTGHHCRVVLHRARDEDTHHLDRHPPQTHPTCLSQLLMRREIPVDIVTLIET